VSGWNYRLMKDGPDEDLFLVEAYYDDEGKPWAYARCDASWLTFEDTDAAQSLVQMVQATTRPILTPGDLVGTGPLPPYFDDTVTP